MLGLKVHKKDANRARKILSKKAMLMLDKQHTLFGNNSFIYLPIIGEIDKENRADLEAKLKGKFGNFKFERVARKSFDIIGNIALIDGEGRSAKEMAKKIMQEHKQVETVISKGGAVKGKYRIRKYRHILGKKNFVALYKENGAELKFDIRKTFFSSRLSFDRLRVAKLVKPKENVMVMFAGMGPFVIEIAKMHKDATVVGIELNKDACNYMAENIKLNRLLNATAIKGDVKKVAEKYKGFADRIVMPLPMSSYEFLGAVLKTAKKKCVVHYYAFGDRESGLEDQIKKVGAFFKAHKRKFKIIDKRVVRQYSPKEVEIVLDIGLI